MLVSPEGGARCLNSFARNHAAGTEGRACGRKPAKLEDAEPKFRELEPDRRMAEAPGGAAMRGVNPNDGPDDISYAG
jgi:hypothetical protein